MKTEIKTEVGTVPVRTKNSPTPMVTGNPELAQRVAMSGGARPVDNEGKHTVSARDTRQTLEEVSYAEKNPEYYDVSADLPSMFLFYPFDTLSLRPLRLSEAKKIFQAQATKSMRLLVEAISSCLQPGVSAFDLTEGDFYFLMYWLRIQSFKKSPYELSFTCSDYGHVSQVIDGEKPQATLFNTVTLHSLGDLNINFADVAVVDPQVALIQETYDLSVYPRTMRSVVEEEELVKKDPAGKTITDADGSPAPIDAADSWTAQYASILSPFVYGKHLHERMSHFDSLGDQSLDLLVDLDKFLELSSHGVQEQVSVACKECGAKVDVSVSINAHAFFPSV